MFYLFTQQYIFPTRFCRIDGKAPALQESAGWTLKLRLEAYLFGRQFNSIISNIQNIWNLIGREEYNIARIVLSTSVSYSLTKEQQHSNSVARKDRTLLIKNKLIIIC